MTKDRRPEIEDELDMDFGEAEVDSSPSSVARGAKKNFVLLTIIIILSGFVFYYIVFGGTKEIDKNKIAVPEVSNKVPVLKPTASDNDLVVSIPNLPPPPPLEVPKPPKPPEPIIDKPQTGILSPAEIAKPVVPQMITPTNQVDQYKSVLEARKKSSIMLTGGSGGSKSNPATTVIEKDYVDSDSYFNPTKTSASQQKATRFGKIEAVIAQGKIIDAVVETALNTDLAGTVRAIVTRDVYAEAGKAVLIPKGSRLIGIYPSTVRPGQDRVAIAWNRLIRPDGIDLMIDSPGIDKLGRAGVEGVLDNKYLETFGNAILLSSVNIGFAVAADKLTNAQAQTTTSVNTGTGATVTQQSGTTADNATQQSVSDLQNTGKQIVQNSLQITPTITIDQGTVVKVFVNKDLIFPAHMIGNVTRFIE